MVGVWKQRTGHPVIIIVEMVATQNTVVPEINGAEENDMKCVGCIWGLEIMK
jgi:hypothetical protein